MATERTSPSLQPMPTRSRGRAFPGERGSARSPPGEGGSGRALGDASGGEAEALAADAACGEAGGEAAPGGGGCGEASAGGWAASEAVPAPPAGEPTGPPLISEVPLVSAAGGPPRGGAPEGGGSEGSAASSRWSVASSGRAWLDGESRGEAAPCVRTTGELPTVRAMSS